MLPSVKQPGVKGSFLLDIFTYLCQQSEMKNTWASFWYQNAFAHQLSTLGIFWFLSKS